MEITIPTRCLVLMIGVSGSGKSSFAAKHFLNTEIVSSDRCRAFVCDDEADQSVNKAAFEVVSLIASKRLAADRLTVIDATNLVRDHRKVFIELARRTATPVIAIVLDLPLEVCQNRQNGRPRKVSAARVGKQVRQLHHGLGNMDREGIERVYNLTSEEQVQAATVLKKTPHTVTMAEQGPFDIIGDVHGCYQELVLLLEKCGYVVHAEGQRPRLTHARGRRPIFLGDLVDRGPASPAALRLAMDVVRDGSGWCLPGNHEIKLIRKLSGSNVMLTYGLAETMEQLGREPEEFIDRIRDFASGYIGHYIFDAGNLVVAHAGLKEAYHGRSSKAAYQFALYGESSGETDAYGLPVRYPWANDYRGKALVVYGHTPVAESTWVNNTICIDTGCVFGGSLTALRYPERELVSVKAKEVYYAPVRPLE